MIQWSLKDHKRTCGRVAVIRAAPLARYAVIRDWAGECAPVPHMSLPIGRVRVHHSLWGLRRLLIRLRILQYQKQGPESVHSGIAAHAIIFKHLQSRQGGWRQEQTKTALLESPDLQVGSWVSIDRGVVVGVVYRYVDLNLKDVCFGEEQRRRPSCEFQPESAQGDGRPPALPLRTHATLHLRQPVQISDTNQGAVAPANDPTEIQDGRECLAKLS